MRQTNLSQCAAWHKYADGAGAIVFQCVAALLIVARSDEVIAHLCDYPCGSSTVTHLHGNA